MNPDDMIPESLKSLLNSPLAKKIVVFQEQKDLAKRLTQDYRALRKLLEKATLTQFQLGRQLVNIREQIGEVNLQKWLTTMCPKIPLEDAQLFMDRSLDSDLARHVDKAVPLMD